MRGVRKMTNDLPDGLGLQTKALHGADRLNETHAVTAAISEEDQPAEFYTRYGNPAHKQVAATIAALEGGEAALVAGSGMGAIYAAVMTLLQQGDHVVTQHNLYSATSKLFRDFAPRWGIERTFVDQTRPEEFAAAIRPNTKLIYVESPSNPLLHLTDLGAVAELARGRG